MNTNKNPAVTQRQSHLLKSTLTKDEIVELRAAFDLFDIKNRGLIEAQDLKATLKSLNMGTDTAMINMITSIVDSLPNGQVNFDQFIDMITKRVSISDSREDLYKVFSIISNNTDYITVEDLQKVVLELNEPLTLPEIKEMINRADLDNDSKVSFEEFYLMMTNSNLHY